MSTEDLVKTAPSIFSLTVTGGGLQVIFKSGTTELPSFSYQDSEQRLNYHGDEIRIVKIPDLGTVVSVTTKLTVDSGSTTFSLLVPRVKNLKLNSTAPCRTVGITSHHFLSLNPFEETGQRDFYTAIALEGTAIQGSASVDRTDVLTIDHGSSRAVPAGSSPHLANGSGLDSTKIDLIERLDKAESEASSVYGQLSPFQRIKRTGQQMVPYLTILFAVVASQSLDVLNLFLQTSRLMADMTISAAWAASSDPAHTTVGPILRDVIFPMTFLVLFIVSFGLSIRDEYFSPKPKPISRDLNRACLGFIIGQIRTILG